jgi:hypothetical protein
MTSAEIKELIQKGFAVGSHSIDHPLYSLIPLQEQIRQTLVSTDWVTKGFDLPYKAFAFPHVDRGVGQAFFREMIDPAQPQLDPVHPQIDPAHPQLDPAHPQLDLILGNSTGMLEKHPRVLHRFIGENPAIPIDRMVKSVLAYSAIRRRLGKQYVQRG